MTDEGKLRLVLDLRHVNAYMSLNKFKCENLRTVAERFHKNDFFIRFDLTSGYHHIDIHPEHQKYLGFHWRFEGNITRFSTLPYSLSVYRQHATCLGYGDFTVHQHSPTFFLFLSSNVYLERNFMTAPSGIMQFSSDVYIT